MVVVRVRVNSSVARRGTPKLKEKEFEDVDRPEIAFVLQVILVSLLLNPKPAFVNVRLFTFVPGRFSNVKVNCEVVVNTGFEIDVVPPKLKTVTTRLSSPQQIAYPRWTTSVLAQQLAILTGLFAF